MSRPLIRRSLQAAVLLLVALVALLPVLLRAEDPPAPGEKTLADKYKHVKGVIVAVVDTGVDAEHPALKGKVLEGINLSMTGTGTLDDSGHGTAMAGLICAESEDADVRGVCAGMDVHILPIKVTPLGESRAQPTIVAAGIRKAVEAGARVICVAMGTSFTSESLEEAMKFAEEKGVIVVAAAGVTKGSHDLYPAAHPWAVSCTVSATEFFDDGDGEGFSGEAIAPLANRSGKTEILGPGLAKVIASGGSEPTSLSGSSIPCGRAAGYAAWLTLKLKDSAPKEIRELLVQAGAPSDKPFQTLLTRVRKLDRDAFAATVRARDEKLPDLVVDWMQYEGVPNAATGQRVRVRIRNIGLAAGEGEVEAKVDQCKWSGKQKFAAIAPGGSVDVCLEAPLFDQAIAVLSARIECGKDPNPANNGMMLWTPFPEEPFAPFERRFSIHSYDRQRAVAKCTMSNPRREAREVDLTIAVADKKVKTHFSLAAGETREFSVTFETPVQPRGIVALEVGCILDSDGEVKSESHSMLNLESSQCSPQYADVNEAKEVVLDAPSQVTWEKGVIPVLFFCPEVLTHATEQVTFVERAGKIGRNTCGLWIEEVGIESMLQSRALSYRPDPTRMPRSSDKGTAFFCKWDLRVSRAVPIVRNPLPGLTCESGLGSSCPPEDSVGWIEKDGWHSVFCLPANELLPPELDNTNVRSAGKVHYLRAFVNYRALRDRPENLTLNSIFSGKDSSRSSYEVILRVERTAALPVVHSAGHFYDIHVHTAAEFSRNMVEPRLSFGGPPWMVLRTAHAMGFISDKDLMLARWSVHPGTRETAVEGRVPAKEELVVSTDHNCFLTDLEKFPRTNDKGTVVGEFEREMRPNAPPWHWDTDMPEIEILRRFFGRGANQELSVACMPQRLVGGPHALAYGIEPLSGPWHGGRDLGKVLPFLKALVKILPYIDFAIKVAPSRSPMPNPGIEDWVVKFLKTCEFVFDPGDEATGAVDGAIQELRRKLLREVCEKMRENGVITSEEQVLPALRALAQLTAKDIRALFDVISNAVEEVGVEPNPWSVDAVEQRAAFDDGSFVAAHPFASGNIHWDADALERAANIREGETVRGFFKRQYPFRGVQIWNEPHFRSKTPASTDELRALNPWFSVTVEKGDRIEATRVCEQWHAEWMKGLKFYVERLVTPGLTVAWDSNPGDAELVPKRYSTRKLFHYAGSDAHGAFNFSTGVSASFLTRKDLAPALAVFGQGHGSEISTAHYGGGRVYCPEPRLEEFLGGRCVPTDGPVMWATLDGDLRFDSKACIWHESWRAPEMGRDEDGKIGGAGDFDGGGTALIRRACPNVVVRYRAAGAEGLGGDVRSIEGYVHKEASRKFRTEVDPFKVDVPAASFSLSPGGRGSDRFAEIHGLDPCEPGVVFFGGYTAKAARDRFSVLERRCLSNPIWFTSVEIGASIRPVVEDGVAIVPPFHAVVTFKCDHSMQDLPYKVLLSQFTSLGDSTAGTIELTPLPEELAPEDAGDPLGVKQMALSGGVEFWRDVPREVRNQTKLVKDRLLIAVNLEPFRLRQPWYPIEGIVTFAAILVSPRDVHGNPLNSVAGKVEVSVPTGVDTTPDPSTPGDPGTGNKPTETGLGGNRPPDTATVSVKPGDEVQLPKGGTCDGKKIPPGAWTVPDLPEKGLSLIVSCGGQTLTLLLTASSANPAPEPYIERTTPGFYGVAPTPGKGPATVSIKNFTQKTLEPADPVLVTGDTCVFSAPQAEPGACDVTVTQGGTSKTTALEAVAPKIAWDQADALPGESRVLRVTLEGAKVPGEWMLSGTIEIANGQILSVTDPARIALKGPLLTLDALPGSVRDLAQVQALQQGKMTATARLRAVRVGK